MFSQKISVIYKRWIYEFIHCDATHRFVDSCFEILPQAV